MQQPLKRNQLMRLHFPIISVASAAARNQNNFFRRFYDRKKPIIGTGKAIIALARKIATLM